MASGFVGAIQSGNAAPPGQTPLGPGPAPAPRVTVPPDSRPRTEPAADRAMSGAVTAEGVARRRAPRGPNAAGRAFRWPLGHAPLDRSSSYALTAHSHAEAPEMGALCLERGETLSKTVSCCRWVPLRGLRTGRGPPAPRAPLALGRRALCQGGCIGGILTRLYLTMMAYRRRRETRRGALSPADGWRAARAEPGGAAGTGKDPCRWQTWGDVTSGRRLPPL